MESLFTSLQDFVMLTFAAMSATGGILLALGCVLLALLWLYFIRIHIAYRMAKNRRRDPLGWVLLSLFVSPILTWLLLLIVGDAN